MSAYRTCVSCQTTKTIYARGLCHACHRAHTQAKTIGQFRNPRGEAKSTRLAQYRSLRDQGVTSVAELARQLGISRQYMAELIRLANETEPVRARNPDTDGRRSFGAVARIEQAFALHGTDFQRIAEITGQPWEKVLEVWDRMDELANEAA